MKFPAALFVCLAFLVIAANAGAATIRYTTPSGASAGGCEASEEKCSLSYAVAVAEKGDEVLVGPGTYETGIATTKPSLFIHGSGSGQTPKVVDSGTPFPPNPQAIVLGGPGDVLADIDVESIGNSGGGIECQEDVRLERVRVLNTNSFGAISLQGHCEVTDSLLVSTGNESTTVTAFSFAANEDTANSIVDSTVIATGTNSTAVFAEKYKGSGTMSVELINTIASGSEADLETSAVESTGSAEIFASHSNFDSTNPEGGPIVDGGGNQSAPPLFIDAAAGNFVEAPGSPTIDAGLALADPPAVDLAGNARVLGSAIDIGAFETARPPTPPSGPVPTSPLVVSLPPAVPSSPQVSALKIAPRTFRAGGGASVSGAAAQKKVGATVSYDLNTSVAVTFSVERKTVGRKSGGKCVARTKSNEDKAKCPLFKVVKGSFESSGVAGANSFRFTGRLKGKNLPPGAYRLTAAAGASSASAGFAIVE